MVAHCTECISSSTSIKYHLNTIQSLWSTNRTVISWTSVHSALWSVDPSPKQCCLTKLVESWSATDTVPSVSFPLCVILCILMCNSVYSIKCLCVFYYIVLYISKFNIIAHETGMLILRVVILYILLSVYVYSSI